VPEGPFPTSTQKSQGAGGGGLIVLELNSKRLCREQDFFIYPTTPQPQPERTVISAESYFVGN